MPTDLEILEELEREIGQKLPRREVGQRLPGPGEFRTGGLSGTGGVSFERFVGLFACGCFLDESANVVGLALWAMGLKTVPSCLGRLRNLRKLTLQRNELTTLSEEIARLKGLQVLDCGNNPIGNLPSWVMDLKRLKYLNAGGCGLTAVPEGIGSLQELEDLYLFNNHIESLPASISNLKHLKQLHLANNKIKAIPPWIFDMGLDVRVEGVSIAGIDLGGNPIESPPIEIIERGNDAVREYFASLEGERLRLNEVKVLLVGDGGAGKTCLVKRLLEEGFNPLEGRTDGINIEPWMINADGERVKVHLWDFGGQEIMHSTHQFFLSGRSVYVLVLDGRKEEDAEYWLKHVESFGGDSPVLVVLNKMDENPGFDVNRRFLEEKYRGIVDFHRVSCSTGSGIDEFRNGLARAIGRVEIIGTLWPAGWFKIKSRLEEMSEHYIGADTYRDICQKAGIIGESSQDTLVDFLRDLGVVVHFPDFNLRHMHVLEPRWLTGAVYRIINSDELAAAKGVLKSGSLRTILKPADGDKLVYRAEHYPFIVELMKKFELCYSIDGETVLVPDLLEVQEPEIDFDYEGSLRFRIDYDFFPKSIIPRFIVRMSPRIEGNLRWRTGVVLEDPTFKTRAVIKADVSARRIYIYVAGQQREDYLTVIRAAFLHINRGFEKLDFTEMVPLFDDAEIVVSYDHLVHLAKEKRTECYPDGAKRAYSTQELLDTLQVQRTRSEEEFISILRRIVNESDDEKTLMKKGSDILLLQPNFMGLGIDLKAVIAGISSSL